MGLPLKTNEELLQENNELRRQLAVRQTEYERRYRSLFNQSTDAVFILDVHGACQDANYRATEMLGYSYDELIAMSFADVLSAEDRQTIVTIVNHPPTNKRLPLLECKFRRKDATECSVEASIEVVYDEADEPLYIQTVVRDITERKAAEAALRESENRFRTIFEAARDAIYIKDVNRVYTHVNPTVEKQNRKPASEIIHKTDADLFGNENDALIRGSDERALAGEVAEQEVERLLADGFHIFHTIKFPLRNETGQIVGLCGIARDVTDRVQAQQNRMALALEREKIRLLTDFIQDASHEFRTPLTVIQTALHLLKRSSEPQVQQHKINQIEVQVTQLTRLIDMLLDISRLDAGIQLVKDRVDINQLCHDVAENYAAALSAKQIVYHQEFCPSRPMLTADATYLQQALTQLMDNAVNFTSPGESITLRTGCREGSVMIEIVDTGMGIKQDSLSSIFQRFWRQDSAHTTPGFGLGLPIAQRIIEAHNGRIEVESEIGKGTTFRLLLPVQAN